MRKFRGAGLTQRGFPENRTAAAERRRLWPDTAAARRLIRVMPEDVEKTALWFDLLLGDNLTGRKDHIAQNGYRFLELADIS